MEYCLNGFDKMGMFNIILIKCNGILTLFVIILFNTLLVC
jgi:hypothetical protein